MSLSDRCYLQFTAWIVIAMLHHDSTVQILSFGAALMFSVFCIISPKSGAAA